MFGPDSQGKPSPCSNNSRRARDTFGCDPHRSEVGCGSLPKTWENCGVKRLIAVVNVITKQEVCLTRSLENWRPGGKWRLHHALQLDLTLVGSWVLGRSETVEGEGAFEIRQQRCNLIFEALQRVVLHMFKLSSRD